MSCDTHKKLLKFDLNNPQEHRIHEIFTEVLNENKPAEFPQCLANTCATMMASTPGKTVTLPTTPDNDDWQTIWNKIKC